MDIFLGGFPFRLLFYPVTQKKIIPREKNLSSFLSFSLLCLCFFRFDITAVTWYRAQTLAHTHKTQKGGKKHTHKIFKKRKGRRKKKEKPKKDFKVCFLKNRLEFRTEKERSEKEQKYQIIGNQHSVLYVNL